MNVHLLRSQEYPSERFMEVVDFLKSFDGPVNFIAVPNISPPDEHDPEIEDVTPASFFTKKEVQFSYCLMEEAIPEKRPIMRWPQIFEQCRNYRSRENIANTDLVFLLTEDANEYNWFSALDPGNMSNGFVHTNDWEFYVKCSATFPVAYLVASLVLERHMFKNYASLKKFVHPDPLGCMNDACEDKRQILLKLRTADICEKCMSLLRGNLGSLHIQQLLNIFEGIRMRILFSHAFRHNLRPGRLQIKKSRILLTDYGNIEINLTPLEKTLYLFYLRHPEGVNLHDLVDYRDDLLQTYSRLATSGILAAIQNTINNLVNVTTNSASEKMATIKSKFVRAIGNDLAAHYIIQGENGERKNIRLNRELVEILD